MVPNRHSCVLLLQSCRAGCSLLQARQVHLLLLKIGLQSSLFFANSMLQAYAKCRELGCMQRLFDEMPQRNSFSWNTLMETYLQHENMKTALEIFKSMPDRNEYSWNSVISGFTKAGDLILAQQIFSEMPVKSVTAGNTLLHGYVSCGQYEQAIVLFKNFSLDPSFALLCVDNFVLATTIGACACLGQLDGGKQIHACIIVNAVEVDSVLGSCLVNMYGKCGDMDSAGRALGLMSEQDEYTLSALITGYANCGRMNDARKSFDRTKNPGVVLWNSMLAGYVTCNCGGEALKCFNQMRAAGISGDSSTFTSALRACVCIGEVTNGRQIHACSGKIGITSGTIFASVLVDMYTKCGGVEDACKLFSELKEFDTILLNSMITAYSTFGRIEDARRIFEMMPARSLISWNSMIVGYGQNGCSTGALELFIQMRRLGLKMDNITLATAIGSCASICHFYLGEQIFARAITMGVDSDHVVSTSLIDLYCKCGYISEARKLFDNIRTSDEALWNCMLMGYATNGYGVETLYFFEEMRAQKVRPNAITMITVLMGCAHCGLVEEGWRWFKSMKNEYDIDPQVEHYSCMIDLLARVGCIEEAIDFVEKMPFEADVSMWSSILRGCKDYGDESRGKKVAERIIELDPDNSGAYVQLSNIYAVCGEWERAAEVRNMMGKRRLKKKPGCSWVND